MFPLLIQVDFLCKEGIAGSVHNYNMCAKWCTTQCMLPVAIGVRKIKSKNSFFGRIRCLIHGMTLKSKTAAAVAEYLYSQCPDIRVLFKPWHTHIFTILLPKTCVIFVTKLNPLLCNIFHFQRKTHFWACVPMHLTFSSFMGTLSCTSMKLFKLSLIPIPASQMCRGKTWCFYQLCEFISLMMCQSSQSTFCICSLWKIWQSDRFWNFISCAW